MHLISEQCKLISQTHSLIIAFVRIYSKYYVVIEEMNVWKNNWTQLQEKIKIKLEKDTEILNTDKNVRQQVLLSHQCCSDRTLRYVKYQITQLCSKSKTLVMVINTLDNNILSTKNITSNKY